MKKIILLLIAVLMSGCETLPGGTRTTTTMMPFDISVTSEPGDAEIYLNDRFIGRTPAQSLRINVPSKEDEYWYGSHRSYPDAVCYLKVSKKGYKDEAAPLEYGYGGTAGTYRFFLKKDKFHFVLEKIPGTGEAGTADEIIKYKKLMDDGVITKDEFEKKKKELLGL